MDNASDLSQFDTQNAKTVKEFWNGTSFEISVSINSKGTIASLQTPDELQKPHFVGSKKKKDFSTIQMIKLRPQEIILEIDRQLQAWKWRR